MGLMKSIEKFKPQAGCRFATYAYWWIRQTITKAIFQHSRTIRLPVMTIFSHNFCFNKNYLSMFFSIFFYLSPSLVSSQMSIISAIK